MSWRSNLGNAIPGADTGLLDGLGSFSDWTDDLFSWIPGQERATRFWEDQIGNIGGLDWEPESIFSDIGRSFQQFGDMSDRAFSWVPGQERAHDFWERQLGSGSSRETADASEVFQTLPIGGLDVSPRGGAGSHQQQGRGDPLLESIIEAQERAAGMVDELDDWYEAELDDLRSMYQLSETPHERASLQFMLEDLEARRDAATQAIETSFGDAIAASAERADTMRDQAVDAGERTGAVYRDAASDMASLLDQTGASFSDTGLGVGGGTVGASSGAGAVQDLSEAAGREQAHAEQMFGLGAQDVAALGAMMEGESQAQQADLQRQALAGQTQLHGQHAQDVNRRIAQDRQAMAQQEAALRNQRLQRQQQLQDQVLDWGIMGGQHAYEDDLRREELRRQQQQQSMGPLEGLTPEDLAFLQEMGL